MNISPVAKRLIDTIESYVEETSKVNYRFTIEEQRKIESEIAILNNQINLLISYELKRKEKDAE